MRGLIRHIPDDDDEEGEDCAAVGDDGGPDEPDEWRADADDEDLGPGQPAFIERESSMSKEDG